VKQYKDTKMCVYFNEISNYHSQNKDDYKAIIAKKKEAEKLKIEVDQTSASKAEENAEGQKSAKKPVNSIALDQIMKCIVRMDLEADGEGYVYFNELLFKTMKMVFGEQHLKNTILVDAEYKALKKIHEIKERHLRKQRAEDRKQAMTVNPFILKMFKHITFKTWMKLYKERLDRRMAEKQEKGDFEVSDAEEEEDQQKVEAAMGHEEFVYETEEDVSCGEEDGGKKQVVDVDYDDEDERDYDERDEEELEEEFEEEEEEDDISSGSRPRIEGILK